MFKITFWDGEGFFETREEARAEVLRILNEEAYPSTAAFRLIRKELEKFEADPDLGIKEVDSREIKGEYFEDHGAINVVRRDDMFVIYTGQGHDISGRWWSWSQIKVGDKLPTGGTFTADMLNEAREKATGVKKFELRF